MCIPVTGSGLWVVIQSSQATNQTLRSQSHPLCCALVGQIGDSVWCCHGWVTICVMFTSAVTQTDFDRSVIWAKKPFTYIFPNLQLCSSFNGISVWTHESMISSVNNDTSLINLLCCLFCLRCMDLMETTCVSWVVSPRWSRKEGCARYGGATASISSKSHPSRPSSSWLMSRYETRANALVSSGMRMSDRRSIMKKDCCISKIKLYS